MGSERAVLAGGCFWGMQDLIRCQEGVLATRVGYTGGDVPDATYRNHGTHAEGIEIVFDPNRTSYRASWSSSSRSTTRPPQTGRVTTGASATARPSTTSTMTSVGSPRTPLLMSMHLDFGQVRW